MIKLGITGGIGSGKSIVSELLSLCNVPVYIADIESKKLTSTSPIIRAGLIKLFGTDLYDGIILNKPLLASYIFTNEEDLQKVNKIIHPEVKKDYIEWVNSHHDKKVVAHEAAILFESGFNQFMDKTVTVYAPLDVRIERTMKRDNTSKEKVLERMKNQISDEEKVRRSDYVIINDGTKSLIRQVTEILAELEQ